MNLRIAISWNGRIHKIRNLSCATHKIIEVEAAKVLLVHFHVHRQITHALGSQLSDEHKANAQYKSEFAEQIVPGVLLGSALSTFLQLKRHYNFAVPSPL